MLPPGYGPMIEKTSLALAGTALLLAALQEKFGWEIPGFGAPLFMFLVGVALLGFGARHVHTGSYDHGKVKRSESPVAFWFVVLVVEFGVAIACIWAGLWLMSR